MHQLIARTHRIRAASILRIGVIIALVMTGNNATIAKNIATNDDLQVVIKHPDFNKLIDPQQKGELLTSQAVWSEGPVCLRNGNLIFSDVKQNKVMQWSKEKGISVWLSPSDYQNGHAIDKEGRVIAASHGKRAILRLEHDGRWATLVDRFNGKQLNSPNDVVVASDGNIWFTDPTFGILNPKESYGGTPVQGGEFIYRYDPLNNKLERIATPEVKSPNGLAFSPHEDRLYIADSQLAHDFDNPNFAHQIISYSVKDNQLSQGKVFAIIAPGIPDGIKVDLKGNVWSSSKNGVQVFNSKGDLLGVIQVPSSATSNLTFCRDSATNKEWLYITAANKVYRIPMKTGG
ncbi:gluconolactonase [Yersinia pseudotuberculosis]|uniref:Gluconolactonase n=2 Tax=Yersinia pseudotuberculosis complex TaxID=1649845 RepID=A0A0T9JJT2_YERPU|nr:MULTISPECIES: SMP-30/gluconolactonase/LRE family protein [Yersinia pseudotuberculosis complex]PSH22009.1 gluconolactonase [Yersinia pseudotuberculosis]CNC84751.1 Gluconolactonase precursor [Yersinia pseudotuberculosis]CRG50764.1 Gluconolactonase precursor [Yersinia wautersii]SUP86506.1 Gluconolactonase precursor [Yersinia pseudotuberculosis]